MGQSLHLEAQKKSQKKSQKLKILIILVHICLSKLIISLWFVRARNNQFCQTNGLVKLSKDELENDIVLFNMILAIYLITNVSTRKTVQHQFELRFKPRFG